MSRTVYGTENIRYNFLLGQYESWGISGATSAMFILAGVAFAVLGIILRNYLPALYAFISTAVGSLLMGIWWERYKRRTSRRAYEASLLAKNTL